MSKPPKNSYVDITKTPPSTGELLYNKFLYANIRIANKEGKITKEMQLIKLRGDLTFTGSPNEQIGNTTIKGTVTFYTNLSGYDNNTSLLQQIKEAIGTSKKETDDKGHSYVTMEIFCGYKGMSSHVYGFSGNVLRIKSERNIGMKSQAWQIEFVEMAIFSNTNNLIWEKPTRKYNSLKAEDPDKNAEGVVVGATYLQILKDIYTPRDSTVSFLDDPANPLKLTPELTKLLDQQLIERKDSKDKVIFDGTYMLDYSSANPKSTKSNDPFGWVLRQFWVWVKKSLDLNDLFLTTFYKTDSSGIARAYLSLEKEGYQQKTYAYLDDSKIIGSPFLAEAAFFEVETVFDPSVFSRDGVIVKSKYFNILTLIGSSGLLEDPKSDIITRDLNQQEREIELPIWHIISYTVNFSNVSAQPAMMVLSLSRDLPPYLIG